MRVCYFACLFILISCYTVHAQVNFKGLVQAEEHNKLQPISFATVVLYGLDDTLRVVKYTITDIKGSYLIPNVSEGRYKLSISYFGYTPVNEDIQIVSPSYGTDYVKNYILKTQIIELNTVDVTASSITRGIDKTSYLITKDDLKGSINGIDLMSKIPQLSFDETTQKLNSFRGGSIKILINGANASEQEVMSLNADQIKSIEYYDFPPAQYANYSNVVNVITKPLDRGLFAGVNLQHAFTTGFANDAMFLTYNWGENQLALNAATSYRNYRNIECYNRYSYILNGQQYLRTETQQRKFGYDDNYINLAYTRNVEDSYLLQVNFSPNFQHSHIDGQFNIIQSVDNKPSLRDGNIYNRTRQFTPALNVYTMVKLKKQQELTIDVVGTLHSAKQLRIRNEYNEDGDVVLNDDMSQLNSKQSFIGELNYTKHMGSWSLSFGDQFNYGRLNSKVDNYFSNDDFLTTLTTNHLYGEANGTYNNFMYRASVGAYLFSNVNAQTNYKSLPLRLNVLMGYNINDHISIRGVCQRITTDPTLSELSNNKIFVSEGIIKEGNPELKNCINTVYALILNAKYRWINSDIRVINLHQKNPINSYFIESEGLISNKYENAISSKSVGVEYSFLFSPFKSNILSAKLRGGISNTRINSTIVGQSSQWSYPINYEIALNYKNFLLSYQGNVPAWNSEGPYLNREERISNFRLRYTYNNLSATAMFMWFLIDADYEGKTVANSLVDNSYGNNIIDNRSMFTLGISYRFNTGKKYKEQEKKIYNTDNDSGLF